MYNDGDLVNTRVHQTKFDTHTETHTCVKNQIKRPYFDMKWQPLLLPITDTICIKHHMKISYYYFLRVYPVPHLIKGSLQSSFPIPPFLLFWDTKYSRKHLFNFFFSFIFISIFNGEKKGQAHLARVSPHTQHHTSATALTS